MKIEVFSIMAALTGSPEGTTFKGEIPDKYFEGNLNGRDGKMYCFTRFGNKCMWCEGTGKKLLMDGKEHALSQICGREMRNNRVCIMDPCHKGRHASVAFCCDGCGKMRRSQPHVTSEEAGSYCFMCASPQMARFPFDTYYY